VFAGKKKDLARRAETVARLSQENPLAEIEVDEDLARFMGAFEEKAVAPGDFLGLGTIDLPEGPGGATGDRRSAGRR
jgi:hypothetical protein